MTEIDQSIDVLDDPSQSAAAVEPVPAASEPQAESLPDAPVPTQRRKSAAELKNETYGSFWIAETEFALPVAFVQEVVNEPDGYAPVPLSPPYMIGVFYLRGTVIPVVDLRVLLGFEPLDSGIPRKVAIIEHGDLCLGLLFDETGGVIYGDGKSRVMFEVERDGTKSVVVEGMLKLDGGARVVQLLDPHRLLKLDRVPKSPSAKGHKSDTTSRGPRQNCISFQIGHTHCAIDLRHVQEIMDVPCITDSPLAHGHVLGNIDLRGHTVPVVEFRGVLEESEPFKFPPHLLVHRKLIILNFPEGLIALLVYSVDSIVSYFESDILPFARIPISRHDMIRGCLIQNDTDIVILFDYEKLKEDKELALAARSCREIFPKEGDGTEQAETERLGNHAERRSFIVFSVGQRFALDVTHVSEVLNKPTDLLTPPFALQFVDGIYNLRGELVPLINVRRLYSLPDAKTDTGKVLIFQYEGGKFGLLVDSIDEMVRTSGSDFLTPPSLRGDEVAKTISEDVLGCLSVASEAFDRNPVLVLKVQALVNRCVVSE